MRKLIAIALLILLSVSAASAYVVPAEYRTSTHMNDIEVYQVSIEHMNTPWGFDNIRQLAQGYTDHGYPRDIKELAAKMEYYASITKLGARP